MESTDTDALRRRFDEAFLQAAANPAKAAIADVALRMIAGGKTEAEIRAEMGEKVRAPTRDIVEKRRAFVEPNFRRHGFDISVPRPDLSAAALKRLRHADCEMFFRPATADVSYAAWMTAHGQADHFTVVDAEEREKIEWEDAPVGYWFAAHVFYDSAYYEESWKDLFAAKLLLSLEEYAIVYWTHRDRGNEGLDGMTECFLRTRAGAGALTANGQNNGVDVAWRSDEDLAEIGNGNVYSRAVKMARSAA